MLMRVDGHHAPDSTVLRALRRSGRVKARARLARLHHAEPARRDRDGRTGDHRDPAAWRPSAQRAAPHADPETGEIRPIALVTDNGPCFKAARLAAFIEKRPEPIHIRTPRKSPNQNGVRERAFGPLKYEHLYRLEIDDGSQLGLEVETYRQLFNAIRPHEALAMRRPLKVHLEAINDHQTIKSTEPETLPLS